MTRSTVEQGEPLRLLPIIELVEAVENMADVLAMLDSGDTWASMTCTEVESIAAVLRAAGRDDVAHNIIEMHAESDEPGDLHHPGYDVDDNGEYVLKEVEPHVLATMENAGGFDYGVNSLWHVEAGKNSAETWFHSPDGRGRVFYDSKALMIEAVR